MKKFDKKFIPSKAVVVVWRDHCAYHEPSWFKPDEVEEVSKKDAPLNVSVGWPIHVDKDTLTLAQTIGADGTMADSLARRPR